MKEHRSLFFQVVLLNGSWDTSNKIPNIIAEMHNVNIEELRVLQNTCPNKQLEIFTKHNCSTEYAVPSPKGSDSGIEVDCSDGNLSWLLNYKIHELPPVPGGCPFFKKLIASECRSLERSSRFTGFILTKQRSLLTYLACFVNNRLVI